ncbi:MAG TPA: GldG family protein, partial [bacterium]|nr:GldG family protein [bacterium]
MKKIAVYSGWLGLLILLAGLIIYSLTSLMNWMVYAPLILGAILLVASAVLQFEELKKGLTSRSAKYSSNAALMIAVILGLLVVANIFASRFSWRWDTTAAKQFSLAEQTRTLLKNLKQDVKVTGFFKSGEEGMAKELLTEYAHYSDHLKFEFNDPDKKPGLAKKYQVKAYGTLIVEGNGKEERIEKSEEQLLTNAIIKVTREGKKKIYFTSGHGEKDPEKSDQNGLNKAKTALVNENYEVGTIVLAQENNLPADCSLLVIAGPKSDLFGNEKSLIRAYLKKGG